MNLRYDYEKDNWICDEVTLTDYIDLFVFFGKLLLSVVKLVVLFIPLYFLIRIVFAFL